MKMERLNLNESIEASAMMRLAKNRYKYLLMVGALPTIVVTVVTVLYTQY